VNTGIVVFAPPLDFSFQLQHFVQLPGVIFDPEIEPTTGSNDLLPHLRQRVHPAFGVPVSRWMIGATRVLIVRMPTGIRVMVLMFVQRVLGKLMQGLMEVQQIMWIGVPHSRLPALTKPRFISLVQNSFSGYIFSSQIPNNI